MDAKGIESKLIEAGSGIFYVEEPNILPAIYLLNNIHYVRFCDFILLPESTDKLSSEQIVVVNGIRNKYFDKYPQFRTNTLVKQHFQDWIKCWKPENVLEIGPSFNPLINRTDFGISSLFFADLDQNAVNKLKSEGLKCDYFDMNTELSFLDNSVDLIFAIFVLQFSISAKQFDECYRVLRDTGVFIANVYKRSDESRNELRTLLISAGFHFQIIEDPERLCDNHEYWVLFKSETPKHRELINSIKTNSSWN